MNCPKGCKKRGKPIEMQSGKVSYDRRKKKRVIRKYCPSCFYKTEVEEKTKE